MDAPLDDFQVRRRPVVGSRDALVHVPLPAGRVLHEGVDVRLELVPHERGRDRGDDEQAHEVAPEHPRDGEPLPPGGRGVGDPREEVRASEPQDQKQDQGHRQKRHTRLGEPDHGPRPDGVRHLLRGREDHRAGGETGEEHEVDEEHPPRPRGIVTQDLYGEQPETDDSEYPPHGEQRARGSRCRAPIRVLMRGRRGHCATPCNNLR